MNRSLPEASGEEGKMRRDDQNASWERVRVKTTRECLLVGDTANGQPEAWATLVSSQSRGYRGQIGQFP